MEARKRYKRQFDISPTRKSKSEACSQRETVQAEVKEHVEPGSPLYTDEWTGYSGLDKDYIHEVINHAKSSVIGRRLTYQKLTVN